MKSAADDLPPQTPGDIVCKIFVKICADMLVALNYGVSSLLFIYLFFKKSI
jgi:hypothetical protein